MDAKSSAAAYAALVAYQKGEDGLTGDAKSAWHARAIDANIKFAQTFPDHPESNGVLTRAAEDIFAAHDLPRAMQVSQVLLARVPPVNTSQQRIAWNIIGQSQYELGVYDQAEIAFIQARERSQGTDPANVQLRADLTERIAESVYRQGEARQKGRRRQRAPSRISCGREGRSGFKDRRHLAVRCRGGAHQPQAMGPGRDGAGGISQAIPDSNAEDVTRKLAVSLCGGEPARGCGA